MYNYSNESHYDKTITKHTYNKDEYPVKSIEENYYGKDLSYTETREYFYE